MMVAGQQVKEVSEESNPRPVWFEHLVSVTEVEGSIFLPGTLKSFQQFLQPLPSHCVISDFQIGVRGRLRVRVLSSEHAHFEKCRPLNLQRVLRTENSYSYSDLKVAIYSIHARVIRGCIQRLNLVSRAFVFLGEGWHPALFSAEKSPRNVVVNGPFNPTFLVTSYVDESHAFSSATVK